MNGRKRAIAVDTMGLLLGVAVGPADVQDADSAPALLRAVKTLYVWLQVVFADRAYNRIALVATCFTLGLTLAIVRRADGATGFQVIPRRWVVERTFGWLGRYRRLSKDYEELPEVSEAMVTLAAIRTMLQRLTSTNHPQKPGR